MAASSETVIRTWFEELWNQGKEATIDRLLAVDATVHGLPAPDDQPVRGRDGFKEFYRSFRAAFPDIQVAVERTVTEGNFVTAHCRVTGRQLGDLPGAPASGKPVEFWGMVIVRVDNGQITEGWNSFDFLGLYQQLGLLPSLPA